MGAGILPVAFNRGRAYFLFARERAGRGRESGLWSDFGGGSEKGESFLQTAVREAHEESMGLMGSLADIEDLINTSCIGQLTSGAYRTYVVEVEYDDNIPEIFKQTFDNAPKHLIEPDNGLYEKDRAQWVRSDRVGQFQGQFRKWYHRSGIPYRARKLVEFKCQQLN